MDEKELFSNSLVRFHNDFSRIGFLTPEIKSENLLLWCITRLNDKKGDEITLSFNEVATAAQMGDTVRFSEVEAFINTFIDELSGQIVKYERESNNGVIEEITVPFFSEIRKRSGLEEIVLAINPKLEYLANSLTSEYTAFPAIEYYNRSTAYSKRLYKQIATYRTLGFLTLSKEMLVKLLGIPASYRTAQIKTKIIEPAIEDLQKEFPNLECEYIKRGRTIKHYRFTWDKKYQLDKKEKEISKKKSSSNKRKDVSTSFTPAGIPLEDQPTEEEIAEFLKDRY